jgi:hypothetical protein
MHEGVFSLVAGLVLMLACVVERGASRPPRGALGNAKVAAAVEPRTWWQAAGATWVADLMLAVDPGACGECVQEFACQICL